METIIKIKITNIKVDDRYYSFDYNVSVDGVDRPINSYDSDHAWQDDIKAFKTFLKNGYAAETILHQIKL